MECQGVVTKVDPHKGYFEVDNKFIIHMSFLKALREKTNLPQLQCKVDVKYLHKFSNIFVACIDTVLEGDFNVNYTTTFFTELIRNNKLGYTDIIFIHKTLNVLDKNFKFESNELKEMVIKSLFLKLIEIHGKKSRRKLCLSSIISHIDLETINEYRCVESRTKKLEEYPKWFFGIHSKLKKTSILFGFLHICTTYGLFMMDDLSHRMPVIVTNKESNADLTESCYVLIEDYKIITEIFNNSDILNFEYLLVDFNNIIIVHALERKKCLFGTNPPPQNFKFTEQFILFKKSSICLRADNQTETYLEVGSSSGQKAFLILGSSYTQIILHLKLGFRYKMFYNSPLEIEHIKILESAGKFEQYRLTETQGYFQEVEYAGVPDINNILPVSDYKKYTNSDSVSFEAVVDSRWFVENKYPEYANNKLYGFSTPGPEVHVLSFLGDSKMYLSAWINRLMPFGLIPEMRLIIKNVVAKSTFIQTTLFTYFEIIRYEPKVPFQTVNFYLNREYDWGPSDYLSRGNDIPTGVILWSHVENLSITDVKMTNRCKMCQIVIEAAGPCTACGSEIRDMKFNLVMYSMDLYGKSRIIATDVNVLKLVLDMHDTLFSKWLETFGNIGEFSFNAFNSEQDSIQLGHIESNSNLFGNILKHLIISFNNSLDDKFEIKCRKFYDKTKTINQYPVWFYLDARKDMVY